MSLLVAVTSSRVWLLKFWLPLFRKVIMLWLSEIVVFIVVKVN